MMLVIGVPIAGFPKKRPGGSVSSPVMTQALMDMDTLQQRPTRPGPSLDQSAPAYEQLHWMAMRANPKLQLWASSLP
jgi:hypothetical protein